MLIEINLYSLSPESLHQLAQAIDQLRSAALFDPDGSINRMGAFSEGHFLLALAALETAQRHATLAAVWLSRKE